MSLHNSLDHDDFQSFNGHHLPAHRSSYRCDLYQLPHKGLCRNLNGLRKLPPHQIQCNDDTQSCHGKIPDRLQTLPYHNRMDSFAFQSCNHHIPVNGHSHYHSMRQLPYQRICRRYTNNVPQLSFTQIQCNNQSQSYNS